MSPLVREYEVPGDDFARAGEASGHIKSMLKELGFAPAMIRRVAITTYEAEINMVIHAGGGEADIDILPDKVTVVPTMARASPTWSSPCRRAGPRRPRTSGRSASVPVWVCPT